MGGKQSKARKEKKSQHRDPLRSLAAERTAAAPARGGTCRRHFAQGDLHSRLLRDADLLPARAGRDTATAHIAAMALFHLLRGEHGATGSEVPSDVPQTVLAVLAKPDGTYWRFVGGVTLPGFGDGFVFYHVSCQMAIAFYGGGNGWFSAYHRVKGTATVMSSPGHESCSGGASLHRDLFERLDELLPEMFDVTTGCSSDDLPQEALRTGSYVPVDIAWDESDAEAVAAGGTGPSFTVVQREGVAGPVLRMMPTGAVRLTDGGLGFRMFLENEASMHEAADAPQ